MVHLHLIMVSIIVTILACLLNIILILYLCYLPKGKRVKKLKINNRTFIVYTTMKGRALWMYEKRGIIFYFFTVQIDSTIDSLILSVQQRLNS